MNQTQTRPPLVRRAGEPDADELARMLSGLTDLSRYFRFQTAIGTPPRQALLLRMLCPTGAAFVATRDETIVGHAMWAWAPGEATAELAAVIAEDDQRRGLGIRMLSIAAADAIASGATHFLFVVSAANDRSLRMLRRRWPNATVERDGAQLTFTTPARLPNHPKEPVPVINEQPEHLNRDLRPMHDVMPAH
ncbi:acetyltransferase (GNAT) family protein [Kribbella sp. VKM Ac-2571]|uniref:GNAT family N-acetyltransferase n=1 Tax=Kribbella sp. VKM Ac-2571 TaxID=2512222 RepID=UPI00105E3403|nr:GNAT family N-acetyltransferase [Kribbella sp. VKM Ac-2571]TDO47569.1 acetyltransferase (GNAT) family protein [Kribbella sp. VKM Ac-2571]